MTMPIHVEGAVPDLRARLTALGTDAKHRDEAVAELIEADGLARIQDGANVDLSDYLAAVPALPIMPTALDTAIDVVMRCHVSRGTLLEEVARSLAERYPPLRHAVERAALLTKLLDESELSAQPSPRTDLPCRFGALTTFGEQRYTLDALAGRGSAANVYLATDHVLSDPDCRAHVAIKLFSPLPDVRFAQEILDEARKVRRVDHPNVVRILDAGISSEGEPFIVMEWVEGGDLGQRLQCQGPLSPEEAVRIIEQVARAVHAVHDAGFVHGDLKPANIVLTGEGVPKLTDFGVGARATREDLSGLSIGNLAFMPPEQYRGSPPSASGDIYALGGLLSFLICGAYPNGGARDEVAARMSRPTAVGPRDFDRSVDIDLDSICRRALSPTQSERYGSADQFAQELRAWQRRQSLWRTPERLARRMRLLARSLWARESQCEPVHASELTSVSAKAAQREECGA